jgi:hypothetical protein
MWARVFEIALGLWLVISPFIFMHGPEATSLWVNDLACGSAIILLALLSFWRPGRHAHFGIGLLAIWLIGFGYMAGHPAPAAAQNHILLGLTLLMFAIIPNEANLPPEPWRT